MSSELANWQRQASELRAHGPKSSWSESSWSERQYMANELRAGEHPRAHGLRGSMANELRTGEYQPHADCPTEAGTYRKVLTLPPADKNAMIMGKKVQLT